jgi:1-deoxy-D-xylulose-5-phosphate synthase
LVDGFGTAVLELLNDKGINIKNIHRLGIPDRFLEHGSRDILLESIGIDSEGIYKSFLACWSNQERSNINKMGYKKASHLV